MLPATTRSNIPQALHCSLLAALLCCPCDVYVCTHFLRARTGAVRCYLHMSACGTNVVHLNPRRCSRASRLGTLRNSARHGTARAFARCGGDCGAPPNLNAAAAAAAETARRHDTIRCSLRFTARAQQRTRCTAHKGSETWANARRPRRAYAITSAIYDVDASRYDTASRIGSFCAHGAAQWSAASLLQ